MNCFLRLNFDRHVLKFSWVMQVLKNNLVKDIVNDIFCLLAHKIFVNYNITLLFLLFLGMFTDFRFQKLDFFNFNFLYLTVFI
jgi:hypothetical protein